MVNFSAEHQELLKRFLSFFALKRDQCDRQVCLALADAKEDCLGSNQGVVFTKGDVERAFGRGTAEVGEAVRGELDTFYRMAGVFVQMLLFNAEQQGATLKAEVTYTENYKALEELKDFEKLGAMGDPMPLKKKAVAGGKLLPGLGAAMALSQEQSIETQQLKEENERVKQMVTTL